MKKTVVIIAMVFAAMFTMAFMPAEKDNSCACMNTAGDNDEDSYTWGEEDPFSLETIEIPENFDDLKKMAETILANVTKNTSKDPAVFHKFKSEIDAIDDKLDLYDDALEVQFTDGKIRAEDYRRLEKSIDAIDELLDKAEDQLEKQFGFDD